MKLAIEYEETGNGCYDCVLKSHCKHGVLGVYRGGTFGNPKTEYITCKLDNRIRSWKIKNIEPHCGPAMACG
jgi:hypothetical protein